MKIAILTTFRSMPETYSLVNDVRDRIKTLQRYGHEVVFFAEEGCKGTDITCETRAVVPRMKLQKDVVNEDGKKKLVEVLKEQLKDFDLAITDDWVYIRQYITHKEAVIELNDLLPNLKWVHWGHSRISEKLNLKMPRTKYVWMNYSDADNFAKAIGVDREDVHVVFNDKDPRIFFEFYDFTKWLIDKYDLLNYDVMQVFPFCMTRWQDKGVKEVIRIFGEIKKRGKKVKLVLVNSNSRKDPQKQNVEILLQYGESIGLERDKDLIFTSRSHGMAEGGVERRVIRELMMLSNLFIFPSISEVCSNVLLEASMTKNLIVLNSDFKPFFDFGDDTSVLSYPFGSCYGFNIDKRKDIEGIDGLVSRILEELKTNRPLNQFLRIKNDCNVDSIYKNQLKSLLEWVYE